MCGIFCSRGFTKNISQSRAEYEFISSAQIRNSMPHLKILEFYKSKAGGRCSGTISGVTFKRKNDG